VPTVSTCAMERLEAVVRVRQLLAGSSRTGPQVRRWKADIRRRAEAEFSSASRRAADGRDYPFATLARQLTLGNLASHSEGLLPGFTSNSRSRPHKRPPGNFRFLAAHLSSGPGEMDGIGHAGPFAHCGWIFAARMTSPQRLISAITRACACAGVLACSLTPRGSRADRTFGEASASCTAWFRRSITGVPAGTAMAFQDATLVPGKPACCAVGAEGSAGSNGLA
jgi:hypothetical protein